MNPRSIRTTCLGALVPLGLATAALAQPANNNCANFVTVVAGTHSFTTVGATTDGPGTCAANQDVWYRFVATVDGTHSFSTCGLATWDTYLGVYDSTACPPVNQVACLDDGCALQTPLTFTAVMGRTYTLRVGGFSGSTGVGQFSINPGGPPPPPSPNENCATATAAVEGNQGFNTTNSTTDGPADACNPLNDVWYVYNSNYTGTLTISTCTGTSFDTALAVYAGGSCPPGAVAQCNNDSCGTGSSVSFPVSAGSQWTIRVGGNGNVRGTGVLRIVNSGAPPTSSGPDVILSTFTDITHYGPVGGTHAYAIQSTTCNIGDTDLIWGNSHNGTPALAMNAYRLENGRLVQLGLGYCKKSCCAAAGPGCPVIPTCNGHGGSVLGVGCLDPYGSGYNGSQGLLGARSSINPYTGTMNPVGGSGDAIARRLQVPQADMDATHPTALFFVEGVYVGTDDALAGNWYNNATYRRVTVNTSTYALTPTGAANWGQPTIKAWRANGLGLGVVDARVVDGVIDVPNEGRFHIASKVTDLGGGNYRYDYAIFNLCSERAGGSFSVPVPAGAVVSNVGFRDVNYHSGESYVNTDWVVTQPGNAVTWSSPQTYAQNQNSNALRWGTMYNFWFETDRPPADRDATLGIFAPGTPTSVVVNVPAPRSVNCPADFNNNGSVSSQDLFDFLAAYFAIDIAADFNGDNVVSPEDIYSFLAAFFAPCD